MILKYKGADITDKVTVDKCVVESWGVGRLSEMRVEFDDAAGEWGSWSPEVGDAIEATCDGACGSGAMYVSEVRLCRGRAALTALPVPSPLTARQQVWTDSTMLKAANQLASQLSLGVAVHGAKDIAFKRLEQRGRSNLAALAECCALMGCMLDIFDGEAHIVSTQWAASQKPAGTIEISGESSHSMVATRPFASCSGRQAALESKDRDLERKALSASFSSGKGAACAWEVPSHLWLSSASQIRRCCEGIVRYKNSAVGISSASMDGLVPWTPGAVVQVACDESGRMSGKAMVTRVRNDFVSKTSKVWWRLIR